MSDELPMADDGLGEISDRLQEYNKTVQEQAFLLGHRNGYRGGELMQDMLQMARRESSEADSPDARAAWMDVEHHLAANGAFLKDSGEAEITHPPGMNTYIGAVDGRPHIQVAGERIHIEDFDFQWEPSPDNHDWIHVEPQGERGQITITAELNLPEDSEERDALMEFIQGLADG